MKFKLIVIALVLLLLAGLHLVNETREQEMLREDARIASETKQQMKYIQSLQAESDRIFSQDQDVQNLLEENTSFKVYEIIHNESFVEYIYSYALNQLHFQDKI